MIHSFKVPLAPAKELVRWLWLMAIFVVVGSLLPADSLAIQTLDQLPMITDKMEHTAMYAVLAFLPAIYEKRGVVIAAAAGVVALGVGLEFGQLVSGWRQFEIADMLADVIGVGLGLVSGIAVRTRVPVRIRA